jgi:hypothetical protein
MWQSRYFGAFISGLALYSAGMLLTGALPGGPRPLDYNEPLPQLLGETAAQAVLLFVLAMGWAYLTLRPYRRSRRQTTAWCLGGLGMAWLGWQFYGLLSFAVINPPAPGLPVDLLLLSSLVPLLWGVLSGLAVLAGILLVRLLLERHAASKPP